MSDAVEMTVNAGNAILLYVQENALTMGSKRLTTPVSSPASTSNVPKDNFKYSVILLFENLSLM